MSITIVTLSASTTRGWLVLPGSNMKCALGKNGIHSTKCEGDGATPAGNYKIRRLFYRADRIPPPATLLPSTPLTPNLGWCDDSASARYNQLVRLPFEKSHEKMWRQDHLYDIVIVLGYNDCPVVRGHGSAVFLHIARNNYEPTEGCVAISLQDMRHLVAQIRPGDRIKI